MSKPIAFLYLPANLDASGERTDWSICREIADIMEAKMPDYYWIAVPDHDATRIELKVFYEKDFTPIQYEELKSMIEKQISTSNLKQ
jgi:hypothetical protein